MHLKLDAVITQSMLLNRQMLVSLKPRFYLSRISLRLAMESVGKSTRLVTHGLQSMELILLQTQQHSQLLMKFLIQHGSTIQWTSHPVFFHWPVRTPSYLTSSQMWLEWCHGWFRLAKSRTSLSVVELISMTQSLPSILDLVTIQLSSRPTFRILMSSEWNAMPFKSTGSKN